MKVAHLDVSGSLLAARLAGLKHIDESVSYIYREVTAERVHVVLAFDRSGSMAEGQKLEAAKKALLALYVAVRRRYLDATVDVLAFDNEVQVLDLVELWGCRAGAFTNTAEVLRAAHLLLAASRSSRRELYLITDGLPEAYTDEDGRVRSGQLDVAMERTLERARELATVSPLKTTIILLKSEHPEYESAARAIARTLGGDLVVTEPANLGIELLVRWARGTEVERRVSPAPRARSGGGPVRSPGPRSAAPRRPTDAGRLASAGPTAVADGHQALSPDLEVLGPRPTMSESREQAQFRQHLSEMRKAAGGLGHDFANEFSNLDGKIERSVR